MDEMEKNVQCDREEMDRMVMQQRAAVDAMIKEEREKMDKMFNHIYEGTDIKLMLEREEVDQKLIQERASMDQALQKEREKVQKQLKKIHNDMDLKLQRDRVSFDLKVQLERARMDCNILQARADMEQKLQQEHEDIDHEAMLRQVQMEANMMQDLARIDPTDTTEQIQVHILNPSLHLSLHIPAPDNAPKPDHILVMEFAVHVDYDPQGYSGARTGHLIINEPYTVEWGLMKKFLKPHGYKGNADLYYLKPGYFPPDGLVLLTGPEHVDQMMEDLEGRKQCDLYIARNAPPPEYHLKEDDIKEEEEIEFDYSVHGFIDVP